MLQLRRKQTIIKEIHKGGGPPERPAPFVGGGRRPPHLWRLAFGLSLEFCSKASNSEKPLCEKPLLRPHQYSSGLWTANFLCTDTYGFLWISMDLY